MRTEQRGWHCSSKLVRTQLSGLHTRLSAKPEFWRPTCPTVPQARQRQQSLWEKQRHQNTRQAWVGPGGNQGTGRGTPEVPTTPSHLV